MSVLSNRRRIVLAAALALTLVAVVWANRMDGPQQAAPVASARAKPVAAAPAADLGVLRVAALREADETQQPRANVFAPKSFYVAPPAPKKVAAPPAPPPPPPPTAPPLPFTFMGMLREASGAAVVFITRGERMYSVRAGDVIDGTYRVDAVGAGEMTFVYLPMNEKQTLRIGESS